MTERERARRRHQIRAYARTIWGDLVRQGAWRVEHYVALISLPDSRPSLAAETIKPIIDAGTDCGLWPDDDAYHRKSTIYTVDPHPPEEASMRITVSILPVSSAYQIPLSMGRLMGRLQADSGYTIGFQLPARLWVTSNLTDSDIMARQHGACKASDSMWGRGLASGQREQILTQVKTAARQVWERENPPAHSHVIVVAGVGYSRSVEKAEADPDNSAETVTTLISAATPKYLTQVDLLAYYRLPVHATGGTHTVQLLVFPTPSGFSPAPAVAATTQVDFRRL